MIYNKVLCNGFNGIRNKQFQQIVLKNYARYIYAKPNINNYSHSVLKNTQWCMYPTKLNLQVNFPHSPTALTSYRGYSDKLKRKTSSMVLSNKEKLTKAVKEYGSTVIIFHIGISLLSLGLFYALVSSGIDLTKILQQIGLSDDRINKLAGNAGTFVVAYAVHKVFAPVRMGITATATPFIVRYLRNIGWLKK